MSYVRTAAVLLTAVLCVGALAVVVPDTAVAATSPYPAGAYVPGAAYTPDAPNSPHTVFDHLTVQGHSTARVQVESPPPARGVTASSVQLNLRVQQPGASGYLTAFQAGTRRPATSNLNFAKGQITAAAATVQVNSAGQVDVYVGSTASVRLTVDVLGFFVAGTPTAAGAYRSLTPGRVLDTRSGKGGRRPGANSTVRLKVLGAGGVPTTGVSAVALSVTAVAPTRSGYVTVHSAGSARTGTSNLNFAPQQSVANEVLAKIGTGGAVDLDNRSAGSTDLLADVLGYYRSGTPTQPGTFVAVTPTRVLDRNGDRSPEGITLGQGPLPLAGVASVAANITVVSGGNASYVYVNSGASDPDEPTVYPPTIEIPAGRTAADFANGQVGINGTVIVNGRGHVLGDVFGYYRGDPAQESGTIAGTVRGPDGQPLPGVTVSADQYTTYTDANGHYVLFDIDPRPAIGYAVCFQGTASTPHPPTFGYGGSCYGGTPYDGAPDDGAANPPTSAPHVHPSGGTLTDGIDGSLTVGGAITGRISDSSTDVAVDQTQVTLFSDVGYSRIADGQRDGTYFITGLAPREDDRVCVDAYPHHVTRCYAAVPWTGSLDAPGNGARPVTVTSGRVTTVDFALPAAASISGRITSAATGAPVSGSDVIVYNADGSYQPTATTGDDGTYVANGLEPGATYRVCVDPVPASGSYAPRCWRDVAWNGDDTQPPPAAADPVTTGSPGAQTAGIDVALPAS